MNDRTKAIITSWTDTIRNGMITIDKGGLGVTVLVDPETEIFKGIITDGDIRRALLKGHGFEEPIIRIIKEGYITATTETTHQELLDLFNQTIRIIPILDKKNRVVDIAAFDKKRFLPVAEPSIGEKEWQYVSECILSGWVSSTGKFVTQFEKLFADFCQAKHAITTSSGTTALHLALLAADIGPGDEVLVPTLTFIATANAVTYTGAKPVFVDSEPATWNIDPAKIEASITSRTKAIIPVHLYGHPADMGTIKKICKKRNLILIEDAAEAHGAQYDGAPVGGLGDLGIFSFFGNKIMTTGEGGMVVTNNDEYAAKIRVLRDHGMDKNKRYWHPVLGYNYRLTNVQAALGVAQVEKIEQILAKKRANAKLYSEKLLNVAGVTLPGEMFYAKNVYWLYSILINESEFGLTRDMLMKKLQERGIETRQLFYPVHSQPIYATGESFPVAENISRCGLSLPSSVKLTEKSICEIAETIKNLAE